MPVKRSSILLAATGIVLLGAATVTHFAVAPSLTKIPGSLDDTTSYDGTMSMPDPASPGKTVDQPIVLERRVRADSVEGNTAVITLSTDAYAVPRDTNAGPLSREVHRYAVNRDDFGQADPPSGVEVTDQLGGAVFALPRSFDRRDHRLFDANTRQAVALNYLSSARISGRSADTFGAESSGAVADPALLAQLRAGFGSKVGTDGTSVPTAVAVAMGIPTDRLAGFDTAAPVTYRVHTTWQISADRAFGVVLALTQTVRIDAVIGDVADPVLVTTLQRLDAHTSETSIADTAAALDSSATKLALIEQWIPFAAALIGLGLLVIAILRRTPTTATQTPATSESPRHVPADLR
ncbi:MULTISPECIES: porin PorA family protein [Nocardia]|uniref:porin PorA family protein n=1 Tax=Nocardia TaxID=1817 RepID=UPI001300BB79|nr:MULTISPECIES: porin PorA family protein [Nocardia]